MGWDILPQKIRKGRKQRGSDQEDTGRDAVYSSAAAAQTLSHVQFFCDPVDCSLSGSSVHGILQARILEWVAISSSRGFSQPRDQTCVSCVSPALQAGSLPLAPPGKSQKPLIISGGSVLFLPCPVQQPLDRWAVAYLNVTTVTKELNFKSCIEFQVT